MLPISESNHEAVPAPISILQLERSSDGRATLAPDPHLPQKTEGKKEWENNYGFFLSVYLSFGKKQKKTKLLEIHAQVYMNTF